MTTKKEGPGKDDVRAGDAAQPKKPYATIDLKATEVETKDTKPAGPAASAPAGSGSSVPAAGAKPADTAKPGDKPAGATAPKPEETKPAATAAASAAAKPGTPPKADAAKSDTPRSDAPRADTPKVATPSPRAPEPRRGGLGSFLSHMAAGIAGGFLALLGADTLGPQLGLPVGSTNGAATADLQKRLAAVEQSSRATTPAADLQQKLASAEQRLAKLDELAQSVAAVSEAQSQLSAENKTLAERLAATPQVAEDANGRVAKLEDQLAAIAAAAENNPNAGRVPQLAAITGKVADLETTINNQLGAIRKSVAEQIESRVTVVADAAEAAKSGTVRMDRDLSALKTESAKLGTRMETLKADGDRLADTLRVLQTDTGGLKSALDALKGDVEARLATLAKPADIATAVSPVTEKLAALEQNLQGVVKSEEDRRANAERIVLSLELGNLKRVLDRGQPYAAELADVQKASGGKLDLATLERFKDQGVPTTVDLSREFRTLTGPMLDADGDPTDGSVVDRLWAGAKSVVRVRKVSHTADDKSAEAIVARMEQALKDNRLGDVIERAQELPPNAAAPAKAWLAKVDARASVERAIAAIEGQLKSSLAGAPAK